MSVFTNVTIGVSVTLKLDEAQARALDAIVGYGDKAFLEVFYKHLGKAYLEPHERGLIALFDNIRHSVPNALWQVDGAREVLAGHEKKKRI